MIVGYSLHKYTYTQFVTQRPKNSIANIGLNNKSTPRPYILYVQGRCHEFERGGVVVDNSLEDVGVGVGSDSIQ